MHASLYGRLMTNIKAIGSLMFMFAHSSYLAMYQGDEFHGADPAAFVVPFFMVGEVHNYTLPACLPVQPFVRMHSTYVCMYVRT